MNFNIALSTHLTSLEKILSSAAPMSSFAPLFIITTLILFLCGLGLGISYLVRGRVRNLCRRCGDDPTEKSEAPCSICQKR